MASSEKFRVALEELRERLQWAIDSLEVLRVLMPIIPDEDEIEKRVEEMIDAYSGIFNPTIGAHIRQGLVQIYELS